MSPDRPLSSRKDREARGYRILTIYIVLFRLSRARKNQHPGREYQRTGAVAEISKLAVREMVW